ncbi:MAG: hypothetical protein ATN34_00425 [Epulopiscium sp. Nele67-Bin002]|nr:MAG: hypothetical protein BEN18_08105 [Epulopiscium sp. Nuni2H_MBin001]OON91571.1 MAG: hypothetical protein ATN34_00425 [Epulopiscium sp. Nele67-Bin002]
MERIIGHKVIKEYFTKVLEHKKLAHSYIFEGQEGVGRNSVANVIAKSLLCLNGTKPCNTCSACHQFDVHTHPDIIRIDKDARSIKIDVIRKYVVRELSVKPYQSEYKVIVVNHAEALTVESQNALLKAIEDPPSYGVIIFITNNIDMLLPTIKSRCIHIRFSGLTDEEVKSCIKSGSKAIIKFANGSIGVAKRLVEDEDFKELRAKSVEFLSRLETADIMQLYDIVNNVVKQVEILDFWILWYRDLLLYKSTGSRDLYYADYERMLVDMATGLNYHTISDNLDNIQTAKLDILANSYALFVIENLLLRLKGSWR